jgi:hypothetical protein
MLDAPTAEGCLSSVSKATLGQTKQEPLLLSLILSWCLKHIGIVKSP